jgi:hypothetical protein
MKTLIFGDSKTLKGLVFTRMGIQFRLLERGSDQGGPIECILEAVDLSDKC